jgi:hypothetical protein
MSQPTSNSSPDANAPALAFPGQRRQQTTFCQLFILLAVGTFVVFAAYGVQYIISPFLVIGPGTAHGPTEVALIACMFMWLAGVALAGIAIFAIAVKSVVKLIQFLSRTSINVPRCQK